jgi:hypothetical protein
LLRGKITSVDTFVSPQQWPGPTLPSCQPQEHRSRLLAQLNDVVKQVSQRPEGARHGLAERETVAVFPSKGATIAVGTLGNVKADTQVIGVIQETGAVLLDVKDVKLGHLRDKVDAFADDERIRVSEKDGETIIHRAAEAAIAPIERIALATC